VKEFQDFILKIFAPLRLCAFALILFIASNAQTLAPGAPENDAQWATAGKQGVGTSATLESKIWFTLAQGVMTEVYYPDVTVANVHLLQFVVVNKTTGKIETEKNHTTQEVEYLDEKSLPFATQPPTSLSFYQTNWAKDKKWRIRKKYITDPVSNSVLIDLEFIENFAVLKKPEEFEVYVYFDPSIKNSGMHDTAWTQNGVLLASDENIVSALASKYGFIETTNGFLGTSDGLTQLKSLKKLDSYNKAENGNVVQFAKLKLVGGDVHTLKAFFRTTLVLSFGKTTSEAIETVKSSIEKGFKQTFSEYEKGWTDYVKTLPKVDAKYQAQLNMAAMILKAHEDKTHRGANIASLTVPWGGGENANENNIGGYHLVWSRDLYQVATAYIALGDTAAANRALDFVFNVQQKPDGSFPQNSFLDGKPFWGSLQLDEVAFPLILAYQLRRFDKATYENHVKKAADFLVKTGPKTPQERWEEKSGYSPSTIAAEIAGLVCAAEIARKNADEASALVYLAAADDWARKVEMWTATTNGKYGDGNYYIRLTENGKPDALEKTVLNNGAGTFIENEIVDAGFLELVRLGIKSPDDPLIQKSLKVVDEVIKVNTPNGAAFYRYNHDGYGEMDDGRRWNWDGKYTGKGRLWALLSGERGQYELALASKDKRLIYKNLRTRFSAKSRIDAMLGFANEGLMIPEQIWDGKETPIADKQFVPELKFGEGTGSATPLAWAMAQFIRLAVNLKEGRNLDTPDVVYNRYVKNTVPGQASNFGGMDENVVLPVKAGEKFSLTRQAVPNAKVAISYQGATKLVPVNEKGEFSIEINAPGKEETGIVAVEMPDGATAFERVKIRSIDGIQPQKFSAETIEKIKTAKTSPLFENGKAILFYRGAAQSVMVAGDMTGWNPGRIYMQKTGDNLYAASLDLSPTARAEYKFIVDGKWILDELNPNKLDNGVGGENSVLEMPDYKPTEWDKEQIFKIDGGAENTFIVDPQPLEKFDLQSKIYGTRKIYVYLPPNYAKSKTPFPVLYFQDGTEYFAKSKAAVQQENLIGAGKIKPFIMVFLDPKDRTKEYWASDDYARFVATEVVPAIDAKYNTIKSREGRAIIGASLGGVTSVWVGLKYPEIFSRIGGQSSSFWIDNERVVRELAKLEANKTKYIFYLDDGTLEGTEDLRRVCVMLRGKGYQTTCVEGETGHNWTSWRDRLANAFVAFMN
jgi:glucan 1,4-alpha-glucosidase